MNQTNVRLDLVNQRLQDYPGLKIVSLIDINKWYGNVIFTTLLVTW